MQIPTLEHYRGKSVLISGVCGTVGSELLRQLIRASNVHVVGFDNNESALFLSAERYALDDNVDLYLGDLRDRDTLHDRMRGIDVVFHTAALKHVYLSERSPRDAIQSNIIGTQNIIDSARANGVEQVNLTSSDKAVNPTNVMGTSKLMGERLMTAASSGARRGDTMFFSTRFGNVLGSSGSVLPLFRKQISEGGPVRLTDKSMTRFVMTLEQAATMVMEAAQIARGGEVFVTKMPAINIADLAMVMIEELAPFYGHSPADIEIEVVGPRPGEKMYEELLTEEESRRANDLENFIVINPAIDMCQASQSAGQRTPENDRPRPWNSSVGVLLNRSELRDFLFKNDLMVPKTSES